MSDEVKSWRAAIRDNDAAGVRAGIKQGMKVNALLDDVTPLALAAIFGRTEAAAILLEAGALADEPSGPNRDTPLIYAAAAGSVKLVQLLLERGANARYCGVLGDALWLTSIHADSPSYREIVELLLGSGVDPAQTMAGRRRLAVAARNKRMKGLVRQLADRGANVNEIDDHWAGTPLHVAIDAANDSAVAELIEAGADAALPAPQSDTAWSGLTPLEFAQKNRLKKIVALLSAAKSPQASQEISQAATKPTKLLSVSAAWERIEAHLKGVAAKTLRSLNAGAKPKDLKSLATKLGITLSRELADFFGRHDGQDRGPAFVPSPDGAEAGFQLLPISAGLRQWQVMQELLEGGDFDDLEPSPDPGVKAAWWNAKWFPIAANGLGDLICLDFAPAKGGKKGQVISFYHDRPQRQCLAPSLTKWWHDTAMSLSED